MNRRKFFNFAGLIPALPLVAFSSSQVVANTSTANTANTGLVDSLSKKIEKVLLQQLTYYNTSVFKDATFISHKNLPGCGTIFYTSKNKLGPQAQVRRAVITMQLADNGVRTFESYLASDVDPCSESFGRWLCEYIEAAAKLTEEKTEEGGSIIQPLDLTKPLTFYKNNTPTVEFNRDPSRASTLLTVAYYYGVSPIVMDKRWGM